MPEQVSRRARLPSRPNTTRSPSTSPGRTRAWRRSRSTCSKTTRSAGARVERERRQRRLPDGPGVRQRLAQAALLRLAGPADRHQAGARLLAVGAVRPATGATKVTVLVEPKGAKHYRTLKTSRPTALGYWSFSSSTPGRPLAGALDEPARASSTKARRSPPTDERERPGARAPYDEEAMPELPEVEITARLLDGALRGAHDRVGARAGDQRAEDVRPAAVGARRASDDRRRCAGAAST